jgi:23S rRNA pseudouridine2605 synthase
LRQRLQRLLASAGVASRRKAEDLIKAGRVTVDGRVAELGESADPDTQQIQVDGRPLVAEAPEYWLLNKPVGVVATARDPQERPTVVDFVSTKARVFPVGRLDLDTTGVLLLTNDGELAYRLLHPRFGVQKEYVATVRGRVGHDELDRLKRGVDLDDGITSPAEARILGYTGNETRLTLVIHEGRKRQVRRMLDAVDHPVLALHRRRFGSLTDRGLAAGQVRRLTQAEVDRLRGAAGLPQGER